MKQAMEAQTQYNTFSPATASTPTPESEPQSLTDSLAVSAVSIVVHDPPSPLLPLPVSPQRDASTSNHNPSTGSASNPSKTSWLGYASCTAAFMILNWNAALINWLVSPRASMVSSNNSKDPRLIFVLAVLLCWITCIFMCVINVFVLMLQRREFKAPWKVSVALWTHDSKARARNVYLRLSVIRQMAWVIETFALFYMAPFVMITLQMGSIVFGTLLDTWLMHKPRPSCGKSLSLLALLTGVFMIVFTILRKYTNLDSLATRCSLMLMTVSTFLRALSDIEIRKLLTVYAVPVDEHTLYLNTVNTLALTPVALFCLGMNWELCAVDPYIWFVVGLVSSPSSISFSLLLNKGIQMAGITACRICTSAGVVFGVLLGIFWLGKSADAITWCGIPVVVASLYLFSRYDTATPTKSTTCNLAMLGGLRRVEEK